VNRYQELLNQLAKALQVTITWGNSSIYISDNDLFLDVVEKRIERSSYDRSKAED
jgi:hypothetical protein